MFSMTVSKYCMWERQPGEKLRVLDDGRAMILLMLPPRPSRPDLVEMVSCRISRFEVEDSLLGYKYSLMYLWSVSGKLAVDNGPG